LWWGIFPTTVVRTRDRAHEFIEPGTAFLDRGQLLCGLVLNDLDCMTLRRIQAEQSCASLSLDHEHTGRNVLVPESLGYESRLELPHQFHRQRALQEFVSVLFDRMLVQRRMDILDAAVVRPGNGGDPLVPAG
jgi:hypothetical protein